MAKKTTIEDQVHALVRLASYGSEIPIVEVRLLVTTITNLFSQLMWEAGHDQRQITKITTKFRDAGRRSAPWKPVSSIVPGRPQDGKDGNRINRWLLPPEHKFYADEINASLVEVKYYLQALSMVGAPRLPELVDTDMFSWLIEHPVEPGRYVDPIQLIDIDLHQVVADARLVQSGHLIPLDRGGRHVPANTFLMLARSNQIQGNLTLKELLALMERIVTMHKARSSQFTP